MRNVLVTGGKGFVGRHLVRRMITGPIDYSVTVLDKDGFTGPRRDSWDGIVHLAALARVSDAEKDPELCMQSNMVLTAKILKESAGWIVFSSTCSPPNSVYGMSKQWCEQLLTHEAYKRRTGLRILRFTSVHGDGENPNKLLPMAISSVRNNTPFVLNEGALPVEYVSVKNVVDHIMVAMSDLHHLPGSIKAPKKLCDGVIKTKKQLLEWAENVVHPDAQPA